MAEEIPGANIRCKACATRFFVAEQQKEASCPGCRQGWRIRWFEKGTAMVIAPVSWAEYQKKARRVAGE
ncbi:MAG: hypothetical protein HY675_09135 [Chloroflexi bacterium]|nr:hypothetical protein [Chloroflexota bacterium]